jgi:chromosome segregation ATPase
MEAVITRTEKDLAKLLSDGSSKAEKSIARLKANIDQLIITRDQHASLGINKLQLSHKLRMDKLNSELSNRTIDLNQMNDRKRMLSMRVTTLEEQLTNVNQMLETARKARPDELANLNQGVKETEIACSQIQDQIKLLHAARDENAAAEEEEKRLRQEISSIAPNSRRRRSVSPLKLKARLYPPQNIDLADYHHLQLL